ITIIRIEPVVGRFERDPGSNGNRFVTRARYLEVDLVLRFELNLFVIYPTRQMHEPVDFEQSRAVEPLVFFRLWLNGHQFFSFESRPQRSLAQISFSTLQPALAEGGHWAASFSKPQRPQARDCTLQCARRSPMPRPYKAMQDTSAPVHSGLESYGSVR